MTSKGSPSDEEKQALNEIEQELFLSVAPRLDLPPELARRHSEFCILNEELLRAQVAARAALVAMFKEAGGSEDVLTGQLWKLWSERYMRSRTKEIDDRRGAKLKAGY